MKNQLIKKILIIVMIVLSIYITIECIRGATGREPLIVINADTKRGIKHGLIFTRYTSRGTGNIPWVFSENKLFGIITIWEMTAE